MGKYRMNEPYGFEETFGFNSIRSEIDDEILKNRKTDAQQSEDITAEGEERAAADEAIDSRLDALEEQSESTSQLKEDFDAFTGTTYANDKAALEEKDSALEAKDTEIEQSISDEAARAEAKEQELDEKVSAEADRAAAKEAEIEAALENEKTQREEKDAEIEGALDVINGDGDGSIKKAVADGIAEVVANAPEDLDTLKEVADYIASDKTKAAEIETKLSDHDSAIDALEAKDEELVAKDTELQAAINDEATRATAAESELDGKIVAEQARAEAKEAEIDARDDAQEEEIAKKVDWVVSEGERKHIVLKNHDSILGTATDGGTYNVAMVSKWDVADFGSAQLHANLNSKDGIVTINDDKAIATKDEVEAVDAKVEAIDLTPYAKTEDVNAELANKANASDLSALNDTVGQLSSKVDEKAAQSDLEAFEASSTEALNAEVARAEAKEAELVAKDAELETEINDEATRATAAESELQGKITAEQARAEAKENELAEEIDKKVEWTESTAGRNHIVLKNHDSILGTATDGSTYNVAMVSKWDVADFGSAQLHLNLNSKDAATINDDQVIATENVVDAKIEAAVSAINSKDEAQDAEIALKAVKADVDAALELKADKTELEPLAKSADVTAEIAAAVEPLATKDEVEAVDAKVNAIDLTPYAKTEDMNAAVEALNAKDAELEAAIPQAAADAVAQVVANAPEDFDTLKEVADYIAADKTKAAEIENKLAELEAKDNTQDTVINGKVDRNMNGANGKALIFNESDGGGAKFEHNDGTWSFAGVNDGGESGIAGQLYVVKKNASSKMEGTRIDMTKGAMYYTVGDASAAERMVADNEIAVKGDIDAAVNAIEIPSIEGLAKSADVTAEIASAVAPLAVKADVDAALETKADADKVYTQDEVNNMLAEKQAEIDTMAADFKKLKEIVGDLGGAVEYSVPSDGKLTDMLKKSGIIKLTEDVESNTYAGGITSKNITTLNLNGKTITTTANTTTNPSIMVRGTQQFTIQGSGTLDANGHIAIEANGEDAVITLGGTMFGRPTYVTNREGELIYCYLGTINITNGVFRNDNENKAFLLNCYDANYRNGTAKIIVTGGKFYDFDPANNASEGEGTSYVPDGYVSVASTETIDGVEHTVYTVKKA